MYDNLHENERNLITNCCRYKRTCSHDRYKEFIARYCLIFFMIECIVKRIKCIKLENMPCFIRFIKHLSRQFNATVYKI